MVTPLYPSIKAADRNIQWLWNLSSV